MGLTISHGSMGTLKKNAFSSIFLCLEKSWSPGPLILSGLDTRDFDNAETSETLK